MRAYAGKKGQRYIRQRGHERDAQNALGLLRPPAMNMHIDIVQLPAHRYRCVYPTAALLE